MAQAVDEAKSDAGSIIIVVSNVNAMNDNNGKLIKQTGWYLPEVAHPYYIFKEAGFKVTFASIKGGDAEVDFSSYEDFVNKMADKECAAFVELMRASDPNEKDIGSDKGSDDVTAVIGRDETGDANDRKINKLALTTKSMTSLQGHESEYDIMYVVFMCVFMCVCVFFICINYLFVYFVYNNNNI